MKRSLLLAAITTLVFCLSTGVAWAHAGLIVATPAPGSELGSPPGVVSLQFSEPLNAKLSRVVVAVPGGANVAGRVTGPAEMSANLSTNTVGIYTVLWTTVSLVDGHTLSGSFAFGVGVAVGFGGSSSTGSSPTASGALIALARAVEDTALLLSFGLLVLGWLSSWEPRLQEVRSGVTIPILVAFLAAVAVIGGEAFTAAGGISESGMVSYLTTGVPGLARLGRPVLELAALAVAWWRPHPSIPFLLAAVLALAAAGHAAATDPRWFGIVDEAVHVSAAGVWAGGILALAVQRPIGGWRSEGGRELLGRFTPVALVGFALSASTGVVRGWQEVGSLSALFDSSYGLVLVLKVVLIGALLGLSVLAWRRVVIVPRVESFGVIAVLGVTALLAAYPLPPARAIQAERAEESAVASSPALPHTGEITLGSHAGEFLVGLTVGSDGKPRVFVQGLESDAATAKRVVAISVNGGSVPTTECASTCRTSPVALKAGDRVGVTIPGAGGGSTSFTVPPTSSPSGATLVVKMMETMHDLHTYRLDETLTSGRAAVRARYAFEAPDRFTIHSSSSQGSVEVVWIGGTRYLRENGGSWQQEVAPSPTVPLFVWDNFQPLIDARVIGHEKLYRTSTDIVACFGEHAGTPVWFRFWIDGAGYVRRAEMRAQGHFMDHRYYGFDAPISITPPS
jgi:copper transport protein